MARNIVPAIFDSPYTPDRGGSVEGLGFRIGQPADLSDAQLDSLLAAVGARRKTDADNVPCPVAGDFNPRKLRFVRRDGNSLSLVLPSNGAALTEAVQIRDLIDGAAAGNPVVCIELLGEYWFDIAQALGKTGTPTAGTPSRVTSGGKQAVHSGKVLYKFDGGGDSTITTAVRVDTDVVNAQGETSPPTILGGTWAGCVGDFEPANPCRTPAGLDHRRYVTTFLTTDGYQTTEIPVIENDAADILTCGQAIAGLNASVCIAYRGETNKRLHTFIG